MSNNKGAKKRGEMERFRAVLSSPHLGPKDLVDAGEKLVEEETGKDRVAIIDAMSSIRGIPQLGHMYSWELLIKTAAYVHAASEEMQRKPSEVRNDLAVARSKVEKLEKELYQAIVDERTRDSHS